MSILVFNKSFHERVKERGLYIYSERKRERAREWVRGLWRMGGTNTYTAIQILYYAYNLTIRNIILIINYYKTTADLF
jgi:hypothetical protein